MTDIKPLRGIITPMVTPLKDQEKLDTEGLERLIEHILSGGVHGLFILGTTGEAPGLSYRVRYELVEKVTSLVTDRVPVLVGITDSSIKESLALADHAWKCGAQAVVAAPPFYFTSLQTELENWFKSLADHVRLPLFLYNMPSHTKVNFDLGTIKKLADHGNIIGFKDSSANLIYYQNIVRMMRDKPDFSLLIGPEELLMHSLLSGGHGGVNGGSNMFPRIYVAMFEAVLKRDFQAMATLQEQIMQISSLLYTIGLSGMSYLQGVKSTLSLLGICSNVMTAPFLAFEKDDLLLVKQRLNDLKYIKSDQAGLS